MVFPARYCKFYQSGLADPHCKLKHGQVYDYCEHKDGYVCGQWVNIHGETEEQILERVVMGEPDVTM